MKEKFFFKRSLAMLMSVVMLASLFTWAAYAYEEAERIGAPSSKEYDSTQFETGRGGNWAFDDDSSFSYAANTMEWKSGATDISVTAVYDSDVTVNRIKLPIRVRWSAYDYTNNTPITTADVVLKLKVTAYNSSDEVVSEQTKTSTIASGTTITYSTIGGSGAMWAYMPDIDVTEFTARKIKFEVIKADTQNITSIKEIELYQVSVVPELTFSTLNPKSNTVSINATDLNGAEICYTLDGTNPSASNGIRYTGSISLPEGVTKIKAAAVKNNVVVSEVISGTYVSGTVTNVGVQTDTSKITYGGTFNNSRIPVYAFDGAAGYENFGVAMEWNKGTSSAWAEVSYDSSITADTIVVPVRLRSNAYNSSTNEEISTADVKLTLTLTVYNDDGTVKGTQNKVTILPAGSALTYTNSAMWATLPAIELDEFTAKKIKIEVFTETPQLTAECVDSIKEFEFYKTTPIVVAPTVEFGESNPKTSTVTLSSDSIGTIRYTLDGSNPTSANSIAYAGAITLPNGAFRVKAAIFGGDTKISDTFSKTYVSGTARNVAVQTDTSKITYGGTFNNSRIPVYAFDGAAGYENFGVAMEWSKSTSSAWAEVSYDSSITADTIVVPVRLRSNAYNSSTNAEISTADVKLTLTLTVYNDDGTVKGTQNKVTVLPAGSALTYTNSAMWATLPAIELDEFTAKKIKIEVFTETPQLTAQCVDSVKEFEFYDSKKTVMTDLVLNNGVATATVYSSIAKSMYFIFAAYEDERLTSYYVSNTSISAGSNTISSAGGFTYSGSDTVKAFGWQDLSSCTPITNFKTVEVE